jgi:type VI secretion system secreted protein Hcp
MSYQYYARVKGKTQGQFKAESTKEGRKDKWVECMAFKMGSSVPVDANSGAVKGFRVHKPLVITKEFGAASPQFLQAHWNNEVLDEVVLEIVGRDTGGKKEKVVERITLKDAVIVAVDRYSDQSAKDVSEHDTEHLEDVSFRFRQILVENPDAGTSTSDDWNTADR